jgi:hypothetical protein
MESILARRLTPGSRMRPTDQTSIVRTPQSPLTRGCAHSGQVAAHIRSTNPRYEEMPNGKPA